MPNVGDIYISVTGEKIEITGVDIQFANISYKFSDGSVGSCSVNTFHQMFSHYNILPSGLPTTKPAGITSGAAMAALYWNEVPIHEIDEPTATFFKCECGLDSTTGGGKHSSWCAKSVLDGN